MGSEIKTILILGCGWLGFPLAKELKKEGHLVWGTTRSEGDSELFEVSGINHMTCEIGKDCNFPTELLESLTTLIIAYPLGARKMSHSDEYMNHVKWAKRFLADYLSSNVQVILFSSTSVYPENEGIMYENVTVRPSGAGLIQLNYEEALNESFGGQLLILRLAGLIGPGRHPGQFFAGKVNVPKPNSPINLVHRDDVIAITRRVIELSLKGGVYNLCADVHPSRQEFYTQMTEQIGLVKPTFECQDENSAHAKVVSSEKIRELLKFHFTNPYNCE